MADNKGMNQPGPNDTNIKPAAKLDAEPGVIGILKGKFTVPDDIDAPFPDDLVDLFEGKAD